MNDYDTSVAIMKRIVFILLVLSLSVFIAEKCHAKAPDELDTLWLARAMVAEADWTAERDHAAIAHVFLRKLATITRYRPSITLGEIIQRYCSGMAGKRQTDRQRWVTNLNRAAQPPLGWPETLGWLVPYRRLWLRAIETAKRAISGSLPDPCHGRADWFGGPMDTPSIRLRKVDCGKTANTFYRVGRGR